MGRKQIIFCVFVSIYGVKTGSYNQIKGQIGMYFRFMVHYCVSFKYYRWITSNFLQCNCPRKANTTILHSKSGCKFSPGRTPLEQQQNAELKFSASNKEEEDSNKPRSRENIALPSEEEAVDKRQRRGYRDYRHVQTAVIAVFFRCLCIQFNTFWMQRDKIPQLQCE